MNKKNIKPLILSSLAALSLGSMSVAGTFALFTDKAETKVEIQAGVVDVDAEISELAFYELGVTTPITNTDSSGAYVNSIGGTAKIDGSTLVLNKWAPGDKVTFKLTVKNKSNVDILTRLRETHSTTSSVDLYEALDITYARDSGLDADKIFHWNKVGAASDTVNGETVTVLNVTIEFPNHGDLITAREEGIDNHYQNSNCTIVLSQQAVQGNAEAVDLVSQWNGILQGTSSATRKNDSLTAAIEEVGGTETEAQLKSERIVWNAAEDKFYYEEEVAAEDRYQYFKAYDAMPTVQNWSVYATSSWTNNEVALKGIGFDVGGKAASITSVSYVGEATARINRIYTNSASTNITINAPLDTVQHYGVAGILDIQAVAGSSYHEFGKVAFVEISKGRIALEENSEVAQIHVEKKTESTFDDIIIAKAPSVALPTLSRDDVNISNNGTLVVALQKGTGEVVEENLDYVWLTKQGVFEQVAISDNATSAVSTSTETVYADQLSSSKQETQTAAQQIANNIADQVVIDTVTYNVSVDQETREIVLTNDAQPSQKASAEATAAAIAAGDVVKESGLNETKKGQAAAEQVAIVTVEENDDNVARIGTHGYATLEAAVAAAGEGSTVVLLKDVSLGVDDSCIGWAKGRFSLDLNGHTMRTVSEKGVELNNNGYTSGVFYMSEFDRPVTIKNGTVISKYGTAIYVDGNTADNVATIENVVATNEQYAEGKGGSTHYSSAVRVTSAGHVLIKSGVFSGYNAIDLGSGDKADVCTIEGGTFNGRLTVASSNAQLIIKGGTFDNDPSDYCAAGYRAKQVSENSWQVVEMCQNHNFQYTEIDEIHHKKVCTVCGYEETCLHEYNDECNVCTVCGHGAANDPLHNNAKNQVTLSNSETSTKYDSVSAAIAAFNASKINKAHTLTFGPGIYHLPVNTYLVEENPAYPLRTLRITGARSGNEYLSVISPVYGNHYNGSEGSNSGLFCISGMSEFAGGNGGVNVDNLFFDIPAYENFATNSGIRFFAVYCLTGGSGLEDPIFPETGTNENSAHRYAHNIVVENCKFAGPGGKFAGVVGANHGNCQPSCITIQNCEGEKMNCWFNGYAVKGHYDNDFGVRIIDCVSSNFLTLANLQSKSSSLYINNVDGTFVYHDPTLNSPTSTESWIVQAESGDRVDILNCEWTMVGKTKDYTIASFVRGKGSFTLNIEDSSFTKFSGDTNTVLLARNATNVEGKQIDFTQSGSTIKIA